MKKMNVIVVFDKNKYAGEGNIGHIIEEIKIDMSK